MFTFNSVRDTDKENANRNINFCVLSNSDKAFSLQKRVKMENKIIIDKQTMLRALARLSHEIIEQNTQVDTVYLVGIKRRGVPLAKMIKANIEKFSDLKVELGELDITLYRDDLTQEYQSPQLNSSVINFDVNNKSIVLVDDVLYTGRTARAAMEAIIGLGRPAVIQLAVMVDRGHRELPICANYVGKNIPTSKDEFINVRVDEIDGITEVVLSKNGNKA